MKRIPFFTLALLLLSSMVQAATYYVATTGNDANPGTQAQPFKTIQKGLTTAVNGDTVLVANGTYTGTGNKNLTFGGKALTLQSQGGADNCIVDCQGAGRGVMFNPGDSAAVVDGLTITNGVAASLSNQWGGGIYILESSPTIKNCIITGNVATNNLGSAGGGGIYVENGSPVITNCTLSDNTVQTGGEVAGGGGFACQNGGNPVLSNCIITGNTVTSSATCYGGGIYGGGGGSLTLIQCDIGANRLAGTPANMLGGGLHLNADRTGTITDCQIHDNAATNPSNLALGGGVSIASSATLTRCTLTNNTVSIDATQRIAEGGGFGVIGTGCSAILNDCTLSRNRCRADRGTVFGGGAANQGASLTLNHCLLESNVITAVSNNADGAGVASSSGLAGYPSATTVLSGCILRNNVSTSIISQGGGLVFHNHHQNSRVVNCLFVGNSVGSNGNAITASSSGAPIPIINCTFAGNSGGDSTVTGRNATLTNCIIYGNTFNISSIGPQSEFTVTYCNIQGGYAGTGNINSDPLFVNAAGGDYRLQAGSPCLNAGTASAPDLPPADFGGYARNQGGAPDMGIYEQGTAVAYNFYVALTGSDTNPGTPAAPLRTITKALTLIADPFALAHIYIQQGNYGSDRPRITGRVKLVNWGNTGQARIGKP